MVVNCILIDLILVSFYSSKERDVCVQKNLLVQEYDELTGKRRILKSGKEGSSGKGVFGSSRSTRI